jgi:serine/threonine-protein kinase
MPPPPPSSKDPNRRIPPALEAVVLHAIAKDPAQRYATAAELAAAIVHARGSPEDVRSIRPGVYRIDDDASAEDEARATMPAPVPTDPPPPRTSGSPSSAPPRMSSLPPPPAASMGRSWTLVWVLAAIVSISVGVWLSLRLN